MADILIGVDASASVFKAIAFDFAGRQLSVAATPDRYQTRPDGAGFQSLDDTWQDCVTTLRALGATDRGAGLRRARSSTRAVPGSTT